MINIEPVIYHEYMIFLLHTETAKKYYLVVCPNGECWDVLFDMVIRAKKAIKEHIMYGIVP